jgi:hypothetical protein
MKTIRYCLLLMVFLGCCELPCYSQQSLFASLLKEGDIVFQQLDGGELGRAIDKVTEGYGGEDYNHCGLVININDTLQVIEAIGKKVRLTAIAEFEARCSAAHLLIGRLRPPYRHLIGNIENVATKQLGIPYDDFFEMNNGKLYCSELIYEVFKEANGGKPFFKLKPMTFKDPETHDFFPLWVAYYRKLGAAIPQEKPGINPGLLSRSSKLYVISVTNAEKSEPVCR